MFLKDAFYLLIGERTCGNFVQLIKKNERKKKQHVKIGTEAEVKKIEVGSLLIYLQLILKLDLSDHNYIHCPAEHFLSCILRWQILISRQRHITVQVYANFTPRMVLKFSPRCQ